MSRRDLALGAARLAILPPVAELGGCPSIVSAHELAYTLLDGTRRASGFVLDRQGLIAHRWTGAQSVDGLRSGLRSVLARLLRAA